MWLIWLVNTKTWIRSTVITLTVNTLCDWYWWDTTLSIRDNPQKEKEKACCSMHIPPGCHLSQFIWLQWIVEDGDRDKKLCSRVDWNLFYLRHLSSCNLTVAVDHCCDFRSSCSSSAGISIRWRGDSPQGFFFSIGSEQQGHSIVAIMFNALDGDIYSVGVPSFKEIMSVSVVNSHDCPIEPSFKVRGHLSIRVLMSITDWPLWPGWEMEKMQIFCCRRNPCPQVKTQWPLKG